MSALTRGYADSHLGQLHYCESGVGTPLLMLHQTPRSMDEFADVIPLMADSHRVIAMDMVGFGLSPSVDDDHSIEKMAEGAFALMDALNVETFAVLGHHTGGAVAVEMAARAPGRITHLCISSAPWTDEHFRAQHAEGVGVDEAEIQDDGTHLLTLWSLRSPFYPSHRPDILNRFIRDALAPGVDPTEGHRACARYVMEDRIGLVVAPTLLIGAESDPFALPEIPRLRRALVNAALIEEVVIPDGRIPLMEEHPDRVSDAVGSFLASH
jgi:pimeloyl-ACP methyl ester carboxylesterase